MDVVESYATSLINGWLANDEDMYTKCIAIAEESKDLEVAATKIEEFALRDIPRDIPYPFDMILEAELDTVDWEDIAEEYMPNKEDEEDE